WKRGGREGKEEGGREKAKGLRAEGMEIERGRLRERERNREREIEESRDLEYWRMASTGEWYVEREMRAGARKRVDGESRESGEGGERGKREKVGRERWERERTRAVAERERER
ncbi:hypothetical protein Tco_0958840, partial [Tanacetum coccineum]